MHFMIIKLNHIKIELIVKMDPFFIRLSKFMYKKRMFKKAHFQFLGHDKIVIDLVNACAKFYRLLYKLN